MLIKIIFFLYLIGHSFNISSSHIIDKRIIFLEKNASERFNCWEKIRIPPPILTKFKLKSIEASISSIEHFLTSYSQHCLISNKKKYCYVLNKWLVRQIHENNFLPNSKKWNEKGWILKNAKDYFIQTKFSILSNKLISLMANAYSVLSSKSYPLSTKDKKWFLRRLSIFKPIFSHSSDYSFSKKSGYYKVRRKAHNMYTAHSRAEASISNLFKDRTMFLTSALSWKVALNSTREDGSFPIETRRGARGIYYSNQVFSDLTYLYVVGDSLGINLFSLYPGTEKLYHKSAAFIIDSLRSFSNIEAYAKKNHYPGPSTNYKIQDLKGIRGRISWMNYYRYKWPKRIESQLINTVKLDKKVCLTKYKKDYCPSGTSIKISTILERDKGHILGYKPSCFLLTK